MPPYINRSLCILSAIFHSLHYTVLANRGLQHSATRLQCYFTSGSIIRQLSDALDVKSNYWREQFQTISEDVSVRNVLMHSAH